MSDIELNTRGMQFARNQSRVATFLSQFGNFAGVDVTIQKDNYVAPVLMKTNILEVLVEKTGQGIPTAEAEQRVNVEDNFHLFDESTPDENIKHFQAGSLALFSAIQHIDSTITQAPSFEDYEKYISWLIKALEAV